MEDVLGGFNHLPFQNLKEIVRRIWCVGVLFQQGVTLFEECIVFGQTIQVSAV